MRKVSFPFTVRHGGVKYTPGTPVEVDEKEVSEFLAMGAKLLEEKHSEQQKETVTVDEKVMAEATEKAVKDTKLRTALPAEEKVEPADENIAGQENLFEQPEKPKRKRKPKE